MDNQKKSEELKKAAQQFLGQNTQEECTSGECLIKNDKSLVERINKKIITEDGRQLLF